MPDPLHYSQDTTMRQDDRVTSVTFTLPPDHKWTSVEEALKSAHDQEYELRMAFFWECQRLKAEVERLRKAGDGMQKSMLEIGCNEMADNFEHDAWWASYYGWNAAKDGNANG